MADAAVSVEPGGAKKDTLSLDENARAIAASHPQVGRILGWLSVSCVAASFVATLAGHAEKLVKALFELLGEQRLGSLHQFMSALAVGLFLLGIGCTAVLLYPKLVKTVDSRFVRGMYALVMAGGTVAIGVVAAKALPTPPLAAKILSAEASGWSQELLGLQNADGGLRWSKVDRTVESQVWTTAQILSAALGSNTDLNDEGVKRIQTAFDFIHRVLLPEPDEGWGYMEYVPWGVTEINGWVCVALASSIRHRAAARIWTDSSEGQSRLKACAQLLTKRQMPDGSWAPINKTDNPRFARTYSTVMAVWGLLNARDARGGSTEFDEYLRAGLSWLLQQRNETWGGWVPNPDRKVQLESFPGLTAQVLYVLNAAPKEFDLILKNGGLDAANAGFMRWVDGGPIPKRKDSLLTRPIANNDRSHDSDRYLPRSKFMVEGSTFLWYPWSLSACHAIQARRGAKPEERAERPCRPLESRANELIQFVKAEPFSYVAAESLYAINVGLKNFPQD